MVVLAESRRIRYINPRRYSTDNTRVIPVGLAARCTRRYIIDHCRNISAERSLLAR